MENSNDNDLEPDPPLVLPTDDIPSKPILAERFFVDLSTEGPTITYKDLKARNQSAPAGDSDLDTTDLEQSEPEEPAADGYDLNDPFIDDADLAGPTVVAVRSGFFAHVGVGLPVQQKPKVDNPHRTKHPAVELPQDMEAALKALFTRVASLSEVKARVPPSVYPLLAAIDEQIKRGDGMRSRRAKEEVKRRLEKLPWSIGTVKNATKKAVKQLVNERSDTAINQALKELKAKVEDDLRTYKPKPKSPTEPGRYKLRWSVFRDSVLEVYRHHVEKLDALGTKPEGREKELRLLVTEKIIPLWKGAIKEKVILKYLTKTEEEKQAGKDGSEAGKSGHSIKTGEGSSSDNEALSAKRRKKLGGGGGEGGGGGGGGSGSGKSNNNNNNVQWRSAVHNTNKININANANANASSVSSVSVGSSKGSGENLKPSQLPPRGTRFRELPPDMWDEHYFLTGINEEGSDGSSALES